MTKVRAPFSVYALHYCEVDASFLKYASHFKTAPTVFKLSIGKTRSSLLVCAQFFKHIHLNCALKN